MAMSGICGQEKKPTRLWRNGLEYEEKVVPPDYSNVPNVRDWQMSPFSKERLDLNEVQAAEKLGYKGKAEVERLKKLYGMSEGGLEKKKPTMEECEKCLERQEAEGRRGHRKLHCTSDYLYQPYGPIIVSSISYSRPDTVRPRMYSYLGPSILSGFKYSPEFTNREIPWSCDIEMQPRRPDFRNVYIPYGPLGEIRLTQDQYVPMGPSNLPLL